MRSSHETASPALVDVSSRRRRAARSTGSRSSAALHARERRLPPRALRRRLAEAAAPGRRPHRARDHEGAARGVRGGEGDVLAHHPLTELAPAENGWRASFATPDGHGRGRRRDGRARARAAAASPRPRRAASSRRTTRTRPGRRRGSRSTPAPRRATSTRCSTTRTAAPGPRRCRATRSPRRRAPTAPSCSTPTREEFTDSLGPRDVVSQAIFDEVEAGRGVETEDGRPAVWLDTTRIPEADADVSLPYMLRRYRGGGHRPARRAAPHLPGAPLPERRPRDRHERRDDARGRLRLRRDRRRHARAKPHDGQLAARVRRLRPPRRDGRRDESEGMSTITTTDLAQAVEDAAAHLYVWALKDIPQDLRDALGRGEGPRDLGHGDPRARDDPPQRLDRRRAEEPRLPGHRDRRLLLPRRRALPAPPGADLRVAEGGHGARDASSIRCARTRCTR